MDPRLHDRPRMTPAPTLEAVSVTPVRSAERRLERPHGLGKVLALTLPAGVLCRWAFGEALGLGFAVWTLALVAGFAWAAGREGRQQARGAWSWAVAALFFASMVAVRDAPALTWLNVMATLGLIALAARDSVVPAERTRLLDFGRSTLEATAGTLRGVGLVSGEAMRGAVGLKQRAPGSLGAVLRGLLLALPVVVLFTALLMSGDALFSEALLSSTDSLPERVLQVTDWVFWSSLTGLATAGLWAYSLRRRPQPAAAPAEVSSPWQLGSTEALVVLGSVVLLFATFLAVQTGWLFSQDPSARGTGLTYARYAREGFAELSIVGALTWWLVELSRWRVRAVTPGHDLAVRVVGSLVLSEALIILVSAHLRLALYEEVYGFTVARIFAHAGISFLGLCLLARLVTLWGAPRATASLVAASGLAVLSALNMLNPDATVVRANLLRPEGTVLTDWRYLARLSADAAPALAPLFEAGLSEDQQALAGWGASEEGASISSWNFGRVRARLVK